MSKAYEAGFADGLAWDLDGFDSWEEVERARETWSTATINAIGSDECARQWGLERAEGPAWSQAMSDYDRGAHEGATAREGRSGRPPSGERS